MSEPIDETQLRSLEATFCRAYRRPTYWLGVSTPWGAAGSLLGKILKHRGDHFGKKMTQADLQEYAKTDLDLSLSRNSWSRFLGGTERRAGDKWSSSIRDLLMYALLGGQANKLLGDSNLAPDLARQIRVARRIVDFFFPPQANSFPQLGVQWYFHPSLQYTDYCATPAEARAELRAMAWGVDNKSVQAASTYRTFSGNRFLQVTESGEPCKSFWPMLRTLESSIPNYYIAYAKDEAANTSFAHIRKLVSEKSTDPQAALAHLKFTPLSPDTRAGRCPGEYLSPTYRYTVHSWHETGKHRFNFMMGRTNDPKSPSLFLGKRDDYGSFESWLVAMGILDHKPRGSVQPEEQGIAE